MRCHVRIGRIVSHPCGRKAPRRCGRCGNPVCDKHHAGKGDCVVCTGDHVPPPAAASVSLDEMMAFSEDEVAAFDVPYGARAGRLKDLDS